MSRNKLIAPENTWLNCFLLFVLYLAISQNNVWQF